MTIENMGGFGMPPLLRAMKEWAGNNGVTCPDCGGNAFSALRVFTSHGKETAQIVCWDCDKSFEVCQNLNNLVDALEMFGVDDSISNSSWDDLMDELQDELQDDVLGMNEYNTLDDDLPMACNDNIVSLMDEDELTEEEIIEDVANAFEGVLAALRIDTENDHNTQDTAMRVAKMYVKEIFKGRYQPMPKVTAFPNAKDYDQIYTVDEIEIRSTCAHHFQPIVGRAWVAIYPGDKVIGLSKFARIIDWIASRPTIQEELVEQIADTLEEVTGARGVMVVVKAEHGCCTNRGIKAHSSNMTTSVVRGEFMENKDMKAEAISMFQNFG